MAATLFSPLSRMTSSILLDIIFQCDPVSITRLRQVNKGIRRVIEDYTKSIIAHINDQCQPLDQALFLRSGNREHQQNTVAGTAKLWYRQQLVDELVEKKERVMIQAGKTTSLEYYASNVGLADLLPPFRTGLHIFFHLSDITNEALKGDAGHRHKQLACSVALPSQPNLPRRLASNLKRHVLTRLRGHSAHTRTDLSPASEFSRLEANISCERLKFIQSLSYTDRKAFELAWYTVICSEHLSHIHCPLLCDWYYHGSHRPKRRDCHGWFSSYMMRYGPSAVRELWNDNPSSKHTALSALDLPTYRKDRIAHLQAEHSSVTEAAVLIQQSSICEMMQDPVFEDDGNQQDWLGRFLRDVHDVRRDELFATCTCSIYQP